MDPVETRVAVLEFQANGARPELASAGAGVIANELSRLGLFRVMTSESVRALVGLERQKQLLGCSEGSCGSELGNLLGTDYAVTGKVSRISGDRSMPTTFTLELALLDVTKGKREGSDIQTARTEAELLGAVPKSTVKVVAKILAGRQGSLIVASTESGATVKVDDVTVGTTPVPGAVPARRPGPTSWSWRSRASSRSRRRCAFSPIRCSRRAPPWSPAPTSSAPTRRVPRACGWGRGWPAGWPSLEWPPRPRLQVRAGQLYGDPSTRGSFQYARAQVNAGIESDANGDYRQQATALRANIDTPRLLSFLAAGVAGVAGVASAVFCIAGDAPDRYSTFKRVGVTGTVTPGGASLGISDPSSPRFSSRPRAEVERTHAPAHRTRRRLPCLVARHRARPPPASSTPAR